MTQVRAKSKEDKKEKHQAIIDAAAALFIEKKCLPTVATIAQNSGQAKGTVYLYFSSKEAIFLTLLQQHYQTWFHQIEQTLSNSHSLADLINCIVGSAIDDKILFNLASLSSAILKPGADEDLVAQYEQWFNDEFILLATLLNNKFPMLQKPLCLSLLTDSHALLLGLWQQTTHDKCLFSDQATSALARLWKGYFSK